MSDDFLSPSSLLSRLRATVDNEEIFPIKAHGVPANEDHFKDECCWLWDELYGNAVDMWNDMFDGGEGGRQFPGVTLTDHFEQLQCCWRESYIKAIMAVSKTAEVREKRLLYFMLGYMQAGWEEHLRREHGNCPPETSSKTRTEDER